MLKCVTIGICALLSAACGAPRQRPPPPSLGEPAATVGSPAADFYRIDPSRSEVRILVYRAGALARFGHNHVVVNRAIRGSVAAAPGGAASFSLSIPCAAFVVDDAQARRDEGADFAAEVSDDAKTGTLHNMLSAAVLDADEFPDIAVNGISMSGSDASGAAKASVAVRVAGHESKIEVPFVLERDPRRASASGSVELRQSALGLSPFSLMLGALQVQDTMTIKFKIAALR